MSLRRIQNRTHVLTEHKLGRDYWETVFGAILDGLEERAEIEGGRVQWDTLEIETEEDSMDLRSLSEEERVIRTKSLRFSALAHVND